MPGPPYRCDLPPAAHVGIEYDGRLRGGASRRDDAADHVDQAAQRRRTGPGPAYREAWCVVPGAVLETFHGSPDAHGEGDAADGVHARLRSGHCQVRPASLHRRQSVPHPGAARPADLRRPEDLWLDQVGSETAGHHDPSADRRDIVPCPPDLERWTRLPFLHCDHLVKSVCRVDRSVCAAVERSLSAHPRMAEPNSVSDRVHRTRG